MCMLPTKSLGLAISLQRTQLHIGVTYKLSDAGLFSFLSQVQACISLRIYHTSHNSQGAKT